MVTRRNRCDSIADCSGNGVASEGVRGDGCTCTCRVGWQGSGCNERAPLSNSAAVIGAVFGTAFVTTIVALLYVSHSQGRHGPSLARNRVVPETDSADNAEVKRAEQLPAVYPRCPGVNVKNDAPSRPIPPQTLPSTSPPDLALERDKFT